MDARHHFHTPLVCPPELEKKFEQWLHYFVMAKVEHSNGHSVGMAKLEHKNISTNWAFSLQLDHLPEN